MRGTWWAHAYTLVWVLCWCIYTALQQDRGNFGNTWHNRVVYTLSMGCKAAAASQQLAQADRTCQRLDTLWAYHCACRRTCGSPQWAPPLSSALWAAPVNTHMAQGTSHTQLGREEACLVIPCLSTLRGTPAHTKDQAGSKQTPTSDGPGGAAACEAACEGLPGQVKMPAIQDHAVPCLPHCAR